MNKWAPIRWGDNDRYLGPFTWAAHGGYRPLAVELVSAGSETPCHLRMSALGRTLIVKLPNVVPPYRRKVQARFWSADDIRRMGRDWYWEVDKRRFGFSLNDGLLSICYGRSSMDSCADQRWGCFLPWTQWRHVRTSLYGLSGERVWTSGEIVTLSTWDDRRAALDACPTASFNFIDFDGEPLTATTRIEECEHRFGVGWFKWLSLFRKSRIDRSLRIEFSGETGRRKGSWKGGVTGHSISMLPGELHELAFRRYCAQNSMTFVAAHTGPGTRA